MSLSAVWRAPCGDVLDLSERGLVIVATRPLPGMEPSNFRAPILVVDGERFTLVSVDQLTYRFTRTTTGLYEPDGKTFEYDGKRDAIERAEKRAVAQGLVVFVLLLPLWPFLGMLPEAQKNKLVALGVPMGATSNLSVMLEVPLAIGCGFGGFIAGLMGQNLAAGVLGALCLVLVVDFIHRYAAAFDNKAPGMFSIVSEVVAWVREAVAPQQGDPDKLAEAQLLPKIAARLAAHVDDDVVPAVEPLESVLAHTPDAAARRSRK
jgi:hypothetical protein